MKLKSFNHSISFVVLAVTLFLMACESNDPIEQSKADQVIELLTASEWRMQNVQVDGTDQTSVYQGLKIAFTATGFTSTNGEPIWPATGTWQFTSSDATSIKRNDGVEVLITEAINSKLVLKMTWSKTTIGAGRTSSIGGQHILTFGK